VASGYRPDVQHDEVAFAPRHDGREGGAFGAFHGAHLDGAGGHEGLGVAGRDDGVDFAGLEHLEGDHHRGIALRLEHGHRGVVGRDDAGGLAERDAAVLQGAMLGGEHAKVVLVPDEHQGVFRADDSRP